MQAEKPLARIYHYQANATSSKFVASERRSSAGGGIELIRRWSWVDTLLFPSGSFLATEAAGRHPAIVHANCGIQGLTPSSA